MKTGRRCDGYSEAPTKKRVPHAFKFVNYVVIGPSCPVAVFNPVAPQQQRRAFEYYQLQVSLELAGPFDEELDVWNRLVLQAAYHEEAIRHAVCALGSFHQHYSMSSGDIVLFSKQGLEEYSLALFALATAKHSQRLMEVTLIGCVLFTFCEQLQGHFGSAKAHVDSGFKLLHAYVGSEKEKNSRPKEPKDYQSYIPVEALVTLFRRLHRQLIEIGQPSSYMIDENLLSGVPQIDYHFQSLGAASYALERLAQQLNTITQHATSKNLSARSPEMTVLRETSYSGILREVNEWKIAFDDYLSCETRLSPQSLEQREKAVQILRLWYFSTNLFLQLDSPNEVMGYDNCNSIFHAMVEVGHELLLNRTDIHQQPDLRSTRTLNRSSAPVIESFKFTNAELNMFKNHVERDNDFHALLPSYFSRLEGRGRPVFTHAALSPLPPLFLVTTRCRDPNLRRQALKVLSQLNRRDGFWDARVAATCAGLVIYSEELESNRLNGEATGAFTSTDIKSAKEVRADCRMVGIQSQFGEGRSMTLSVLKAPAAP
ncbi:uncharacterized protein A1O9_12739 [Exophiala aquamarina CBS 119918]|uniref:Uncharacterized protein n=1 Tax=Exophiala aquamarina CBS 119918 TaxID=1182545 RepID=A0A072NUE9_9EURO|nr:uncharacterized protein A1O9_12739 [Exophiala aquamarina CBS 119918]KEF51236.1 hypothetical protein A1O9_12739 [Exophiala aquamarina CBS 119918]